MNTQTQPPETKPQIPPMGIRIPQDLRKWLKHQAVDSGRSLNAEIVHLLTEVRTQKETAHV